MAQEMKFLGYTAAAAGVGYVIGILLAPKSGKQMRRDIAAKAAAMGKQASNRLGEGKEKVRVMLRQANEKAEEARAKGTETLGDIARRPSAGSKPG